MLPLSSRCSLHIFIIDAVTEHDAQNSNKFKYGVTYYMGIVKIIEES